MHKKNGTGRKMITQKLIGMDKLSLNLRGKLEDHS